jgi:quinoprotein glucose dehydrogenase
MLDHEASFYYDSRRVPRQDLSKGISLMLRLVLASIAATFCASTLFFAEQDSYKPKVLGPSDEGLKAIKRMTAPAGTEITLFAAEPMLANPVCFCFDEKGNLYVAETFRLHAGVTDNRSHLKKTNWLDDELACRSVEDRLAMYKKHLGKEFDTYTKQHERVRKLVDTDGDGLPDKAFVFADGFNTPLSGIGAGLLAREGKVWYTCIPDLWLLQDTKGEHKADFRQSLHYGFGVHTAYLGHDLHGLKMGPDGRIYFSSGDRGLNIQAHGKVVANVDSGSVLRCNPDGSELEIVATGLRNPQELVFDQYGNLFTGDNNADGGDRARWVHIVEGGDSGWRIGYQEMKKPTRLGPWNAEKMWHTEHDGQSAHLVPPVGYLGNGPSGVTYHPGIAQIPDRYKEHFFMCDFKGSPGQSGIHTFQLKPRGASFEFAKTPERFVWSTLATDCDFGPDGAFYLSDWVDGWEQTGKGRIYKIADPQKAKDPAVLEVKKILAEGMSKRSKAELFRLLGHADMRVRQEAQFALVDQQAVLELSMAAGASGVRSPVSGVKGAEYSKLARLHGIWGLGMLHRRNPKNGAILAALPPLLDDADADVRCQALNVLGEARYLDAFLAMVNHVKVEEPRVRFCAALALGKLGKVDAIPHIVDMLRDNADKDPYLRHAGVMALVTINDRETILSISTDPSPSVRLASLLAMRRLGMREAARFLADPEPKLMLEAARAINDQPIDECLPQLAEMTNRNGISEPLMYRAVNANFRLKKTANAEALAKFAGRADVPESLRLEALDCLKSWDEPSGRDRIVGLYRPVPAGPAADAGAAMRANLGSIFAGTNKVRAEAAKLAAKFGIKEVGPALLEVATDNKRPAALRVESLKALAVLKDGQLSRAVKLALSDNDARLRTEGRRILAVLEPAAILDEVRKALDSADSIDRQGAFAILGDLKEPGATDILASWLDKLLEKTVPAEVQLELLEAAAKHKEIVIAEKLAKYEASRSTKDQLGKWAESLYGGDAESGRRIFLERSEVSCLRCHKIEGTGGDVGPNLSGIGAKQKREYLLEAIVDPDKQIAQGYETVVLTLVDGKVKSGILKSEDKKEVRLMTPEGTIIVVPIAEIDTRTRGPSAMPADLVRHLSRRDLRDLVEFLASLK